MNASLTNLDANILDHFRFMQSSQNSIRSKFPDHWSQTSIFDILQIIAVLSEGSSNCDFTLVKRNFRSSDTTLERYLNFLRKQNCLEFEIDHVSGRATGIRLTPSTAAAFRSALSVFAS
jgi:response regulator of citrate/malate metabolism